VLVDQFIDRTAHRAATFFGAGLAVHVSFADPICPELRRALRDAARGGAVEVHEQGTYLCIEGPAFSTRAESRLYRSWGVDVIGMTNLQEAKLAREAEMCYATLCLVTDYDCWHDEAGDVSVGDVIENLAANAEFAATVLRATLGALPPRGQGCSCAQALRGAILTQPSAISESTRARLRPILGKYLDDSGHTSGEPL
jgi:5'-methylthioadenosine phosphorylase